MVPSIHQAEIEPAARCSLCAGFHADSFSLRTAAMIKTCAAGVLNISNESLRKPPQQVFKHLNLYDYQ